ncbi:hypothetical protein JVT61DRAFT_12318 [Boletus reticuloceps]|uniref:Integrase core domain-containing protein n=1 Tax=Boletus reticuloceps TaxID=495285 RepID=A0A8I3A3L2_9AGAM|nr:hypothetical protein JVT61DRAFT_12318 [Boletus reticuloceps]
MIELRAMYPDAGAQEMVSLLFHEWDLCVTRSVVRQYFAMYEPELVQQRKARRLQRRFWATGVNDIWAVGRHDKWLRFGLALHTGIEPFSGRILWMKIWHSNRNSQLILSYYIETVRNLGFIPLVTQSDPGTENFGIASAQTLLRQMLDPALSGFIHHRWMHQKKNVTLGIASSQLHRRFTTGFELLLDKGVESGWYDVGNTLQQMVFRWLFIPWLQEELDAYVDRVNNTSKRCDRKKVLPHGIPSLIHTSAEDYGALDFKVGLGSWAMLMQVKQVTVNPEFVDTVSQLYINPDHPVFEVVPPAMNMLISKCYNLLGCPPMTRHSAWDVYCHLVIRVQEHAETPPLLATISDYSTDGDPEANELKLFPGLQDLPYNETRYMGGVGGGTGLHMHVSLCVWWPLLTELQRMNI